MTGNLEESVKDLDKMLELGHVNIYMFEGGTNFGFMNGSNYYDELTPDVTSYDYDALLTEDGQITEKYRRYRDVIAKYREIPEVTFTTEIKRKAYGTLPVKEKVSLLSVLDSVAGVGAKRKQLLFAKYGSVSAISRASKEELAALPGMNASAAASVYDFFAARSAQEVGQQDAVPCFEAGENDSGEDDPNEAPCEETDGGGA